MSQFERVIHDVNTPLRILITNACMEHYTGTEVVVRDLALELLRQGHLPIVYSPKLGTIACEVQRAGVAVLSDLRDLTEPPDVIHGHHHFPVIQALLQFPKTPALYVSHDATYRLDEPPVFPRIMQYIAVDERCRKRVEQAVGLPPEKIRIIANAVDLNRFRKRKPLPARARRAVVFSNYANSQTHLPAVRKACRQLGLPLDVVGSGVGSATETPEDVLPHYDIVFAKARCALEAMTVGNAVVLCDFTGVGPIVTTGNFAELRRWNFGAGVLVNPLRADHLVTQVKAYDPSDSARVCELARKDADLVSSVREWLSVYASVIDEYRRQTPPVENEYRALGVYLQRWHYEERVKWERLQLARLEGVPVLGPPLSRFLQRAAKNRSIGRSKLGFQR